MPRTVKPVGITVPITCPHKGAAITKAVQTTYPAIWRELSAEKKRDLKTRYPKEFQIMEDSF